MNTQCYKSQFKPLPESNCWYKIYAYKWQPTLDKPTTDGYAHAIMIDRIQTKLTKQLMKSNRLIESLTYEINALMQLNMTVNIMHFVEFLPIKSYSPSNMQLFHYLCINFILEIFIS